MNQNPSDQSLEERLATEAEDLSPPFSQQLHQRIMDQVMIGRGRKRLNWRFVVPTIAAMILVAAAMSLYLKSQDPVHLVSTGGVAAVHPLPSVPEIPNPIRALDGPVVAQWTGARYAYLDRDGEKVLSYFSRQLDVVP